MVYDNRIEIINRLDNARMNHSTEGDRYPTTEEMEQYIQVNCFNGLDLDRPIYRFLKFDDFLEHNLSVSKLSMSKPKNWPDPYDALLYKCPARMTDTSFVSMEGLLNKVFAMCWTETPESELLWNGYSYGNVKSIRLKSTPRSIFKYFYDFNKEGFYNLFYASKVVYSKREEYLNEVKNCSFSEYGMGGSLHDKLISSLFRKTDEHRDENEIRFVYYDIDGETSGADYDSFRVDMNEVVEEIILNPLLNDRDVVLLTQKLKLEGYRNSIQQSKLNLFPDNLVLDFSFYR